MTGFRAPGGWRPDSLAGAAPGPGPVPEEVWTGELAPSGRGDLAPTWTSSAKDMVTTSLGAGRVWASLGYGILNEVYWPSTGDPQLRDLGFIVATPGGWTEVKRAESYRITTPAPDIPIPRVVHETAEFRLTLDVVPDPSRDTLLIRYRLAGEGCRLYVLMAPRLGVQNDGNRAFAGRNTLSAEGGGLWACLVASPGFSRTSAGVVGTSDGWQDFDRNGAMRWRYRSAGPGNVALTGELAAPEGLLALGFAQSREGAVTLARSSIAVGFDVVRDGAEAGWADWATRVRLVPDGGVTPEAVALARRSAAVLKVHEDRNFPGAIVASLSVPWGNARNDLGGYHLVWARDAVNTGLALLAIGQVEDARRMLAYLVAMQHADGHWAQNFYPDGRSFWKAVQLDEVGFPVLLASKLREEGHLDRSPESLGLVHRMVERALGFIIRNGPVSDQDRWEENAGLNPYTLAVVIAALVAGAGWLTGAAREMALALAADWNARIEDWTHVTGSPLAEAFGVPGHYLRIVPRGDRPIAGQRVGIRNRAGLTLAADALIGMEFLALARFGLRAPQDPRLKATLAVAEGVLGFDTPAGRGFHRYNGDGYGEHEDGRPFDGSGIGRGWPLLSGERGHYAVQAGEDARPWLQGMAGMAGRFGMLPEQVWDVTELGGLRVTPGRPTGAAMPLAWAHAEFLKLSVALGTGRPSELLASVEGWAASQPVPSLRDWRSATPLDRIAGGSALCIADSRPFLLHFSCDGWETPEDRPSADLALGLQGVVLEPGDLGAGVVFTRKFDDGWEQRDHRVSVG